MKIKSIQDLKNIPEGIVYESKPKTMRYYWTLLFGLLTGDLNPVHIGIFWFDFKSIFGGRVRHGISSVAQGEGCIYKVIEFENLVEITAKGYGSIDYPSPGRIGEKIFYRFTFLPEKLVFTKNRAFATFLMQGIGAKDGAIIFSAEWKVVYNPTSQIRHAIYYQPIPFVGSGVVWNVTTKEEIIIRLMQILLIATIFFSYWLGTH